MPAGIAKRNTKGSLLDLFFIIIVSAAVVIGSVIALVLSDALTPKLQDHLGAPGDTAYDIATNMNSAHATVFDSMALFAMIGMGVVTIILATQIPSHPVMFFISLFVTLMLLLVSPIMSDISIGFLTADKTVAAGNQLPMTVLIVQNWPIMMLIFAGITTVVIYMKIR